MQIWCLARAVSEPLDGEGARLYGGRWNREGTALVYTSDHLSLSVLEQLVHLSPEDAPDDLTAFEIEVPEDLLVESVDVADLPEDWDHVADHPACQQIGELWVQKDSSPVLEVPSAVLPIEKNYLINPHHPTAGSIEIAKARAFHFDERLRRLREGG